MCVCVCVHMCGCTCHAGLMTCPITEEIHTHLHTHTHTHTHTHSHSHTPSADKTILFLPGSTTGLTRQSLGSCFWLTQLPLSFTTIQSLSYWKPWAPSCQEETFKEGVCVCCVRVRERLPSSEHTNARLHTAVPGHNMPEDIRGLTSRHLPLAGGH